MWTDFTADLYPAPPRLAQQSDAPGRTDVLTMNRVVAQLRQQNIAGNDHLFASGWPAGQPEQGAPIALVYYSIRDQVVILTMIHDRQPYHARVLNRATHESV